MAVTTGKEDTMNKVWLTIQILALVSCLLVVMWMDSPQYHNVYGGDEYQDVMNNLEKEVPHGLGPGR
jgi:hypothetical protein